MVVKKEEVYRMTLDDAIKHAREKANEQNYYASFERGKHIQSCKKCAEEHDQLVEWLEELKEYRDLEEKGLLLKLPCKVGTVAYLIDHNSIRMERKPFKCIIDEFTVDKYNNCYAVLNGAENFYMMRRFRAINIKLFGETIFLTKEDAEKAIKRWR